MLIIPEQFDNHFGALRKSGISLEQLNPLIPICPICLQPFSENEPMKKATKEDAPPQSLGGSKLVLTCKSCNNSAGKDIDIHLVNFLKHIDQKALLKGSNRRIKIFDGEETVNGNLVVGDNKELTMEILRKNNDSRKLQNILTGWREDKQLSFSNQKMKLEKHYLDVGILKTAYVLLYSSIGYSLLLWKEYDPIRTQILNPNDKIMPPLWTMQDLGIKDGIYYNNDCWIRGFFVVFSVINSDTQNKRQIAALLPAPQSDFQVANYFLSKISKGDRIRVECLNSVDFLNSPSNIKQLNLWAHGESLSIKEDDGYVYLPSAIIRDIMLKTY